MRDKRRWEKREREKKKGLLKRQSNKEAVEKDVDKDVDIPVHALYTTDRSAQVKGW